MVKVISISSHGSGWTVLQHLEDVNLFLFWLSLFLWGSPCQSSGVPCLHVSLLLLWKSSLWFWYSLVSLNISRRDFFLIILFDMHCVSFICRLVSSLIFGKVSHYLLMFIFSILHVYFLHFPPPKISSLKDGIFGRWLGHGGAAFVGRTYKKRALKSSYTFFLPFEHIRGGVSNLYPGRGPHQNPAMLTPWSWIASLQHCEK